MPNYDTCSLLAKNMQMKSSRFLPEGTQSLLRRLVGLGNGKNEEEKPTPCHRSGRRAASGTPWLEPATSSHSSKVLLAVHCSLYCGLIMSLLACLDVPPSHVAASGFSSDLAALCLSLSLYRDVCRLLLEYKQSANPYVTIPSIVLIKSGWANFSFARKPLDHRVGESRC